MSSQYSFLEKGLSSNSELKNKVYMTQNADWLKYLDDLFQELLNDSCKDIHVKINETPDMPRFQSLISELEFARYFVRNKMRVVFLSSNEFQGRKTPDMLVSSSSAEYFVEVKNIQIDDDAYNFGLKVAENLNARGLSFMIVIKTAKCLSTPAYLYKTRDQKEKNCESALNEFEEKAKGTLLSSSITQIETAIADVELHPTNMGKSFLGIVTMKEAISQPEEYMERIKYDILQKSKKREDWTGDELSKFYIVAIDDDSWLFDIGSYNAYLFGDSTYYCEPLPVPETKIDSAIDYALRQGWKDYLTKMHVLRNGRSVIPDNKRGMLFTDLTLKNVTAIIVKNRDKFYLLANPFADEKINNPNILAELKGCLIGWEY